MKIYCLRHGQSTYNLLGLCNDDPADPADLTALGREQARNAGERLPAAIDHVYVSPLPRARQTAELANGQRQAPVTVVAALRDIQSGFNNRPVSEYFAETADDPLNSRVNGGESLLDHQRRVLEFIRWLVVQPHRTALVVAHEETLRVFVAHWSGAPAEALRGISIANGELLEFDSTQKQNGPPA